MSSCISYLPPLVTEKLTLKMIKLEMDCYLQNSCWLKSAVRWFFGVKNDPKYIFEKI